MRQWLAILCLCAAGAAAWASDEPAAEAARAEDTAGGSRVLAGDDVSLGGRIEGSAIMAGGRSEVAAHVMGDAVLAGGTVEVRGQVDDNVYTAGGDVRIDATVRGDVLAAGGTVLISRSADVAGDMTLAGGSLIVDGRVGGRLSAYAGSVSIDGRIDGDVEVAAERVRLGPEARIGGRLIYRSPERPEIAAGAVIAGGVERAHRRVTGINAESGFGRVIAGVFRALWLAGVLLIGAALILLLPGFSREAAATVRTDPVASLALGFAVLVAVPLAAIVLFITIIGIPLGLVVLLGYGLLLMLGYVTAAVFIGDAALARLRRADAGQAGWRVLFLTGALLLIAMLRWVPWIGDAAVFVLFLVGLGAFTLRSFRGYRQPA